MPIQQLFLGTGSAVATKTYVDDVFSTFLYEGTGSAQSINNGIDLAGEGGMTWIKRRSGASDHSITDTVRGAGNSLKANESNSNYSSTNFISAFNSNGFSIGTDADVGSDDETYASWSFRKAPGFFDVVTWTGNATDRTIAHSLGCVPGFIVVKCTSHSDQWECYHVGLGITKAIRLESTAAAFTDSNGERWLNTYPTSTHFSIGQQNNGLNGNGRTYVAYVFAGGESTAATARSVDFDASGDYLTIPDSADWTLGNTFTIEFWVYLDSGSIAANGHDAIVTQGDSGNSNGWWITVRGSDDAGSGNLHFKDQDTSNYQFNSADKSISEGQWTHCCLVCNSGTSQWYVNGTASGSTGTINLSTDVGNALGIASLYSDTTTYLLNGKISNLRIVKGTAVYTSSFKPPTEPLTNITNTKLLCCNNSSTTGSTVTPGTITAHGDPIAKTDSPFDDPAAFKFGGSKEGVIKCGSYVGTGTGVKPEINLGWEPSFVMTKCTTDTGPWSMFDSMRGIVSGGNNAQLEANNTDAEVDEDRFDLTPTGFKITSNQGDINTANETYIYICIRRPDGYVGKPVELGTSVFAMDTGASAGSVIPNYDSGFPVDFAFRKNKTGTSNWQGSARLIQKNSFWLNLTNSQGTSSGEMFDSNVGYAADNNGSNFQAFMWKRHAGFDVVTYSGNGQANHYIAHSLNQAPDMIWIKARTKQVGWMCGHSGLNGGSNPWHWYFYLNYPWASTDSPSWNDEAPTSTHFSLNGENHGHNDDGEDYVAFLWSNVTGISKCGHYVGNGSTQTITTGFQPRFLWFMRDDGSGGRYIVDTTRGWGSGDDEYLKVDSTDAEDSYDIGAPTSTGFTLTNDSSWNGNTLKYIYYAQA